VNRAERRKSGIRGRRGTVAGLTFVAASTMMTTYGQILRAPYAMATGPCIVNSTGDSPSGTGTGSTGDLRFCINEVNSGNLGPDIFFYPLVNTVTLSAALPDIVQDTTITGGSGNVTITARASGFRFVGVGATGLDVTLDHLTITDFDTTALTPTASRRGAVLYVGGSNGGTIAINDCVISGNEGANAIYAGGGDPTLNITRTTFEDNTSNSGYGYGTVKFRSNNPLTVTDSTFSNNFSNGAGGAIFDLGTDRTTVTGSTFSGNSTSYGGGAIYTVAPTMLITDSTFSGNSARHGGAIYAPAGYVKATRTSFYNNSALLTGAIAASNVTLINSFVGHNHSTATASGQLTTGGVYAAGNADLQFSTVYANSVAADHFDPPGFFTMSQMNVQGHLTSTASIIAADASSGGDGTVFSNTRLWSSTVVTAAGVYPSPAPMSSPDDGFRVGPGQVGLASLAPSPSASPGRLGQPPLPTSVVYTAAPTANPLPTAGITADQVGDPRPNRSSGGSAWTIGSRQLASGASPSPSPIVTPTVTPAPAPGGGGGGDPTPTPTASATSSVFVPVPEPVGSSLAPGGSSLLVNRQPVPGLVVAPNGRGTGVDARGPGFTMTVLGQSGGGRPVALSPTGALQVGSGGRVASRGSGFMPGSQVGVFVDPSVPAARTRMKPRAAVTSLGSLPVDGLGAFDGALALPADVVPGAHVLQVVGLAHDGSTRAVSLGIEVVQQPGAVTITATRGRLLGSVVTVTGRVTGVDASTVVPYVRSGEQGKATAVRARPIVAADGTFTWRLRTKGTVRVFVTAGVIRSNRLVVPAKTTTPTRAPVTVATKPRLAN
jgi:predicted outer membrane repeat protein